jgi:PIN domain nuclease of toxin-antitoxin system
VGGAALEVRLLLDTHIIVWAAGETERLDRRVARAVADPRNELWLSPVSAWELALLAERGRLALRPDVGRWLEQAMAGLALREAPLTTAIALESRHLDVATEDPADRFIAATARAYDCTLVTADHALRRVPGQSVLFCRPAKRTPSRSSGASRR